MGSRVPQPSRARPAGAAAFVTALGLGAWLAALPLSTADAASPRGPGERDSPVAGVAAIELEPAPARPAWTERTVPRARLALDVFLTASGGAAWLGLFLAHPLLARTTCPCTPEGAPAFERFAVRLRWAPGAPLANAALGLSIAAPLAALALVARRPTGWAANALVVMESIVLAGITAQVAKTAVSRPYPYMYGPAPFPAQNADGINYASFWSGHTAVAMAAAVSFAYLLHTGRARTSARWLAWVLGPATALASGLFEMAAGNHFPSDVFVGALAGAGAGLLVPWLHSF